MGQSILCFMGSQVEICYLRYIYVHVPRDDFIIANSTDSDVMSTCVSFHQGFHFVSRMQRVHCYVCYIYPPTKLEGYSNGVVLPSIPSVPHSFLSIQNHISVPTGQI